MTREQMLDLLVVMQAAYPNFYKGMNKTQADAVLDLWATMFVDESFEVVAMAVKAHIANDVKGFPPHIGAIKAAIIKLKQPDEVTEQEAWFLVRRAIGNGIYGSKKEFDALPPILQRLVGSPDQLKEWAMMDEEVVASVVASNFQRSYKARAAHERELLALPSDVRQTMERLSAGMDMRLIGDGDG